MYRPMALSMVLAATCVLFIPAASSAQQIASFYVGGFLPAGEDSRVDDDVLVNNLDFLTFDVADLNGFTLGGEWLVPLGRNFEAGLGVGVYSNTAHSVYRDWIDEDGTEIETDLKLRIIPFSATVRFLPIGYGAGVEPYVGGGVGILSWRYAETGEFVDLFDLSIFRDTFEESGASVGPLLLGGVRVPFEGVSAGFEIRWQDASGDLPEDEFFGTKVDLGGFSYLATFGFRF